MTRYYFWNIAQEDGHRIFVCSVGGWDESDARRKARSLGYDVTHARAVIGEP